MPVTDPGLALRAVVDLERGKVAILLILAVGPRILARPRLGRPPRGPAQLARDRGRQIVVINGLKHGQQFFGRFAGDLEFALRVARFVDP